MKMLKIIGPISIALMLGAVAWGQSSPDDRNVTPDTAQEHKSQPGAAREIGSGAATIGTGTAKGAGALAKGTGKGAVDLVTLHPINAGASIGKGAASAGKDVSVGAVKGTGKVGKGVGRAIKKIF